MPTPLPFCNNLRLGDPVLEIRSGKKGVVSSQPRETSRTARIRLEGSKAPYYFPIENLRLIADGKPEDVPPADGLPDPPPRFEAQAQPIKTPASLHDHALPDGEHIKSYLVTYVNRAGKFTVEKIAAKGIVMAITLFYTSFSETAIVSVICVL